jgi:hypothetical protein
MENEIMNGAQLLYAAIAAVSALVGWVIGKIRRK